IARIHAMTGRTAQIARVDANLLTGRFAVHGFVLAEPDGQRPFADLDRLDVAVKFLPLLRGHLWIRELVLNGSTIRVVRLPSNEFNFADVIRRFEGGGSTGGDVTVERFVLKNGSVELEDQALPQPRTWRSEHIAIEGHNISTARGDGTAQGSSIIAG